MKWKAIVQGDKPSEESVHILEKRTGLPFEKILMAFSGDGEVRCNSLSEGEAQKLSDSLRRDQGIHCRILPDNENTQQPEPLFRVLLANYRPGYRTRLRRRLQELTHLPQDQIVLWLSRMPFALSRGISSEAAKRIKRSVTEAGGIVRIETETVLQDRFSSRRKSNAVFRSKGIDETVSLSTTETAAADSDGNSEDVLSSPVVETADFGRDVPAIPAVCSLPDEYTEGIPPIDEYQSSDGRVFLQPPARFAPGLPAKSHDGGFHESPPVLPDVSNRAVPEAIEFSPPEVLADEKPPFLDTADRLSASSGPVPDTAILYPPPASISLELLLPPVLGETMNYTASGEDVPSVGFLTDLDLYIDSELDTGVQNSSKSREDIELRLFLCTPASDNDARVAEALREVIGVSLRESWDLLCNTPALIKTFSDHKRAIRMAHELESRNVTVSLAREHITERRPSMNKHKGIQDWLKNG